MTRGEIIRTARGDLSMTQPEFAKAVGVSVSTISHWENGHTIPSNLAWAAIRAFCRNKGLDV